MMTKNITDLRIKAHGVIIQEIAKELDSADIQYNRSPICFSAGAPEWVSLALSTGGITSFIASIIIAMINKNRRVRVVFNDSGLVKEIDAPNKEQLIEILKEVKSVEIDR
ncbi:hypothetical protein P2E05_12295 [Providencia stuartii]|uniref:hypothetical protein n=1 Tax=Providencia stuartii TaxID=588 RepID=UPI0023E0BB49|nr:hypothetical protein [Providencia stuartii]ELR5143347.1 hypothetical protein [Providencia stuartii]WER20888.1 hypothetical protein P2E04_12290 [Providencia stuartii]WER25008.1 hypothetical protein P2E05_12295 [Providencia stuartii]WER29098.1 hypothetical protein P2E06_12295 [Providencia stuartii]